MKKILFIFLLILAGCGSNHTSDSLIDAYKVELDGSQKKNWALLTGKWYGHQPTKSGGTRKEMTEFLKDGRYIFGFHAFDKDNTLESSYCQVGFWGISGHIHFTVNKGYLYSDQAGLLDCSNPSDQDVYFDLEDPSDPDNYDAYIVSKLTDKKFVYTHVETGNMFTLKKVADDFSINSSDVKS